MDSKKPKDPPEALLDTGASCNLISSEYASVNFEKDIIENSVTTRRIKFANKSRSETCKQIKLIFDIELCPTVGMRSLIQRLGILVYFARRHEVISRGARLRASYLLGAEAPRRRRRGVHGHPRRASSRREKRAFKQKAVERLNAELKSGY
jgi:hypothetical protein